jgi:D-inositol-3-phosphate glycosyltransferase
MNKIASELPPASQIERRRPASELRPASRSALSSAQISDLRRPTSDGCLAPLQVALLTGGGDKPYALGMAAALTASGITIDFIGSDDLSVPELLANPRVNFLNLRGNQRSDVGMMRKINRVVVYYWRLVAYATKSKPKVFHILWNNKFQLFDRTLLMLYYKLLGKTIVFTAHNVNAAERDARDSLLNRLSLRSQYALSDHIFVHTAAMKEQLITDFGVSAGKISVVPFGINNTVPNTTALSCGKARERLGISATDKTLLFFGNITPYKGLEYLIAAFDDLIKRDQSYRLLIAGTPKGSPDYWIRLGSIIESSGFKDRVIRRVEYVPDEDTELYFKAADVLILPYTRVFQSGVLFLGYNFGLPVIAAAVGSLRDDVIEGETGFVFEAMDSVDLVRAIGRYFDSELFHDLANRRTQIRVYANRRYSWCRVAQTTAAVYSYHLSAK